MITQRDIRRFDARYHRNGVAGEGFHVCRFLYLRGKDTVELQAVVFARPQLESENHRCYVAVTGANLEDRWRGDDFEPALRKAIAFMEAAQPQKLYQYEVTP